MTTATKSLTRASYRCQLAIVECKATRELYSYFKPALDEKATLRRVALLHRGSGRSQLSQAEKDAALAVLRERFDERFSN